MKGIYSMKTYVNPMLQIVSIKNCDIVTTSNPKIQGEYDGVSTILAPGQRGLDDYYEGY